MTGERHALAMARFVVATIGSDAPGQRKLRRSHLRCAAEQADAELARELRVLDLIENARNAHLANLDADEGLAALGVPWHDVAAEAVGILDRRPSTCARCGARLSRRRPVCGRCHAPAPRPR